MAFASAARLYFCVQQ